MGFRAADAVLATHAITNPVTGDTVSAGVCGVILKQVGSQPATFRVRFNSADGITRSMVLDDVTDHDIALVGVAITADSAAGPEGESLEP